MLARREILRTTMLGGVALAAFAIGRQTGEAGTTMTTAAANRSDADFKTLTDAEWKSRLTPEQYYVLRKHGTERAGTSPLNIEKRKGIFVCAGCEQPLFSSETKFESGTGWPSFFKPLDGAVGTQTDRTFFMTRTEVHCSRCQGHLGHVFEDGPAPTGLRYCMNGVAMNFEPAIPTAS